ncbi:WbqC family protein [Burkholderia thailandensis]|uniref:WbnG n=1 Tax=Burkholderia thailandensis (strain ATCC 700388 / DSM 13276 / CCUG 48851 / CIP 106301 / E264) TaxID=271848 RepID=Q2STP3_BURTA|nr:WbqC family protein [Burkholderia thailandensis]ABC38832.1 WbnG [Burkholderia thailandensis E264]AHI73619.1 wbqC-like family protein [Burkholderia thailandensis 2002721723]AHI79650.1 wbqC-like family protein [Burkholderia thailandensis E444]AIC88737.1 wbqC-like family protein [Burkholderia thailandensis USAMRU Malaysia \
MQADRRLAIMQPYFFPYIGYFQLMASVDAFVVYDDVAFINRGWINRNRINVNGAPHMITVPLQRASQNRRICDIDVAPDAAWRAKLLRTIHQSYARAPQFARVFPMIECVMLHDAANLADFLLHGLTVLRDHLRLKTEIVATSRRYGNAELKAQARIVDIALKERAGIYVNAAGGRELYNVDDFAAAGLQLKFLTPGLARYAPVRGAFVPALSIIDVLMCNDDASVDHLLGCATLS